MKGCVIIEKSYAVLTALFVISSLSGCIPAEEKAEDDKQIALAKPLIEQYLNENYPEASVYGCDYDYAYSYFVGIAENSSKRKDVVKQLLMDA